MIEEKKFYLTKEGLDRFKREYDDLTEIKFAKTKEEFPAVLHSEDVNSEYLAFQEDLEFLEVRLGELKHILKNSDIIKIPTKSKQNIIDLGATVTVRIDGRNEEFTLVGSLEADPLKGKISNESPVGVALLGHNIGDNIMISSLIRTIYKVKKVKYNRK